MPIPQYVLGKRKLIGQDWLFTPSVAAIVLDENGHILLQHRTDRDQWGLPGGLLEPAEHPAEAVVREIKEETGVDVIPERIVGTFYFNMAYPNGDKVNAINITFVCRVVGGKLQADGEESRDVRYFPPDALPENIVPFHITRIEQALKNTDPYFEPPVIYPDARDYVSAIRQKIGHDLLIIFAAEAIIQNDLGRVLLNDRGDGTWGLPGGASWLFENAAQTLVREVKEETGLEVVPQRITGVYGGEEHIFTYANGDKAAYFSITFECGVIGGELQTSDEAIGFNYFSPDDLPTTLRPEHRIRIEHAFNLNTPYFYFSD